MGVIFFFLSFFLRKKSSLHVFNPYVNEIFSQYLQKWSTNPVDGFICFHFFPVTRNTGVTTPRATSVSGMCHCHRTLPLRTKPRWREGRPEYFHPSSADLISSYLCSDKSLFKIFYHCLILPSGFQTREVASLSQGLDRETNNHPHSHSLPMANLVLQLSLWCMCLEEAGVAPR